MNRWKRFQIISNFCFFVFIMFIPFIFFIKYNIGEQVASILCIFNFSLIFIPHAIEKFFSYFETTK